MVEFLQLSGGRWLLPLAGVVLLLLIWLVFRIIRRNSGGLEGALADISFDRIEGLVLPNADEGEILIDYLLLTSQGLLILEVKDVQGAVFGGNKLQDWTVINDRRRYTFSNPQPALYDRIAAVSQVIRSVPVAGRVLFLDGAKFSRDVPELVTNLVDLVNEFGESDKNAAKFKIEAFKPHWALVRKAALNSSAS